MSLQIVTRTIPVQPSSELPHHQGPDPQSSCLKHSVCCPPSGLHEAGRVAGAVGAAHLSSVSLGSHASGHACPGQHGKQKEHWTRSPGIWRRVCHSCRYLIRDPDDQYGPFWLFATNANYERHTRERRGVSREAVIGWTASSLPGHAK